MMMISVTQALQPFSSELPHPIILKCSNVYVCTVGLFVHSAVVLHVFFMFYVGLLIVRLSFMSDIVLFID